MKTDVLLLSDVFENFRERLLQSHGLDPVQYITLPSFTWDAMLKYTGVTLELLTDIDMVILFQKAMRGGLSQSSKRYAEANNKYMGEDYDPNKPDTYLFYGDVNNLYGWGMSEYLPEGGFKWAGTNIDVQQIPDDS